MTGEPLNADWIIDRHDETIKALCVAQAPDMIVRFVNARARWTSANDTLGALTALRDAFPISPDEAAQDWFFQASEERIVEPVSPAVRGPLETALAEARGMVTVHHEALTVVAYEVMRLLVARLGADHPACWYLDDRGAASIG